MSWLLVGGIGLVAGLIIGAVIGWAVTQREETRPVITDLATKAVTIPDPIREILEMLRSATVVVGAHDEVLLCSVQSRTYGLVRGTRIAPPLLLKAVREARQSRELRSVDLEITRGPGIPSVHMLARCAPVAEDFIVVLAEDRTAAKRVEETRRDFVANVSHELKTPIGAISLLAEATQGAADDPDAVRQFTNRMSQECKRLAELVRQIIELSRLQSDDPMSNAKHVYIDHVITDTVERCSELAEVHDVTLNVAGDHNLVVLGNQDQIVEALANLVHNAVVYSDKGARVAVSARSCIDDGDRYVDISVSDNGIGIATEDLQRIFERFYRVDYARSRANGGTGLGLSIVKHIAYVHGGSVSVWSQLGQGSTFTIRLPAITESDETRRNNPPSPREES